jgi:uncharacterized protein (TIGR01732 family)
MIAVIGKIGELDLGKSDVNIFNALLKKNGLDELELPDDPGPGAGGYAGGFVLILVLFILLVIIGAGFG